jgi:hypothetical protein
MASHSASLHAVRSVPGFKRLRIELRTDNAILPAFAEHPRQCDEMSGGTD